MPPENAPTANQKPASGELIAAVNRNDAETVEALLARGAKVDEADAEGYTALMLAARRNALKIVRLLLDKGADPRKRSPDGYNAMDCLKKNSDLSPEFARLSYSYIEIKKILGAAMRKPASGELTAAVERNDIRAVEDLLRRGADVEDADMGGNTALMFALDNDPDIVRLLVERGADPYRENNEKFSAWDLLREDVDDNWRQPMSSAQTEIEKILGEASEIRRRFIAPTPNDLCDAIEDGDIGVVNDLLERGADIDGRDNSSLTALMWASSYGHADVVRLLIDSGAALDLKDDLGWTAEDWAKNSRYPDIVQMLQEAPAIRIGKALHGSAVSNQLHLNGLAPRLIIKPRPLA